MNFDAGSIATHSHEAHFSPVRRGGEIEAKPALTRRSPARLPVHRRLHWPVRDAARRSPPFFSAAGCHHLLPTERPGCGLRSVRSTAKRSSSIPPALASASLTRSSSTAPSSTTSAPSASSRPMRHSATSYRPPGRHPSSPPSVSSQSSGDSASHMPNPSTTLSFSPQPSRFLFFPQYCHLRR